MVGDGPQVGRMNHANVTVILINYHSAHHLKNCVGSLTSVLIDRIVIADNDSGPDDIRELESLAAADLRVTVLRNAQNIGFGAGVNRAITAVDWGADDYVWILNPDTIPQPDAPDRLVEALNSGQADIVSPLLTKGPPDARTVWFAGGSVDVSSGVVQHAHSGNPVDSVPGGLIPASFLTGAAPMLTHATWLRLGGFREDLFLYWEDADLAIRARCLGMRMACVTAAAVWHHRGGSSGSVTPWSADYYYYNQRNRLLVCRPETGLLPLLLGRGARLILRYLMRPVRHEPSDRAAKFRASVEGLVDGIRGVTGPRQERGAHSPRVPKSVNR